MTRPTTDELLRRIAIAKAATPGPWHTGTGDHWSREVRSKTSSPAWCGTLHHIQARDDALHIAASDPTTVIGDLEELLALREAATPKLVEFHGDPWLTEVTVRAPAIVATLAQKFREYFEINGNPPNYLESTLTFDGAGYVVTVRRKNGMAPGEKAAALEKELLALRAEVARLKNPNLCLLVDAGVTCERPRGHTGNCDGVK